MATCKFIPLLFLLTSTLAGCVTEDLDAERPLYELDRGVRDNQPKLQAISVPCADGAPGCFELIEDAH